MNVPRLPQRVYPHNMFYARSSAGQSDFAFGIGASRKVDSGSANLERIAPYGSHQYTSAFNEAQIPEYLRPIPGSVSMMDLKVSRANGLPPPSFALKDRRCWRRAVRKAWRRYCEEVSSPSVEEFKCHLPMTGSQLVPSEKSATEPSMVKSRFLRRAKRRRTAT
ncbi:unnamed protein product [Durusdinium trenchii]|uniref:Uncharacterized protein n=1 Tax=Durusdinium trenchii TaxID=1381693 RepID=A0ABP0R9C3_9DINO